MRSIFSHHEHDEWDEMMSSPAPTGWRKCGDDNGSDADSDEENDFGNMASKPTDDSSPAGWIATNMKTALCSTPGNGNFSHGTPGSPDKTDDSRVPEGWTVTQHIPFSAFHFFPGQAQISP